MKWFLAKGVPPLEGSGLPLAPAMLGGSGDAAAEDEDDEELGQQFEEPICALVQNCTMLHNIVGPACIFLRQSFAQAQLVCTHTLTNTPFLDNAWCGHRTSVSEFPSENRMIIFCLIHLQSNPINLPWATITSIMTHHLPFLWLEDAWPHYSPLWVNVRSFFMLPSP